MNAKGKIQPFFCASRVTVYNFYNSWCKFMEKDEYLLNLFSGKISNFQVMCRSTISDKYKGTGGM